MLILGQRLLRPAAFLAVTLWTLAGTACNVPVFRYALEKWEADKYEVIVFHREPLAPEQQVQLDAMAKKGQDGLANVAVTRIDLTAEIPKALKALWEAQSNPILPWMVLKYPRQTGIEPPAWAGPLGPEVVQQLLDSPARRGIARNLLSGDAIVWLLLESGDKKQDNQAEDLVESESRRLEKSLALPERSPLDPPINPGLPLKIAFSTLRVPRTDAAERVLLGMLLNSRTNLAAAKEVLLFPVFGRGRVISPAIGDEIRPEAIREMAEFLTGPCSCEVKEMNPGYDLLLAADWNSLPGYQETVVPESAPLVGISQFAASAATNAATSPKPIAVLATTPGGAPAGPDRLVRNLVVVLGIGVVLLVVATVVLRARAGRRS
jgi:hypothetical protein